MALQKTLAIEKFGTTIQFNDAYISVKEIFVVHDEKVKTEGDVVVHDENGKVVYEKVWKVQAKFLCHVSRDAKYTGKEAFHEFMLNGTLDPDNQNTVHGFIYGMLKMVPEFSDAIDV